MKFLLIALFLAISGMAGTWSGSGGSQLRTDEDDPWFLGDKPICMTIKVDEKFGVDEKTLKEMVDNSFTKWKKFFSSRGLFRNFGRGSEGVFYGEVSKNFQWSEECKDSKRVLEFQFGIKNDSRVNKYFEQVRQNTYAISLRGEYQPQKDIVNGLIWVDVAKAKSWAVAKPALEHLLLHEIGHVLGMPHNSSYVMREDVAGVINSFLEQSGQSNPDKYFFGSIEKISTNSINSYLFDPFKKSYDVFDDDLFLSRYLNNGPATISFSTENGRNFLHLKLPKETINIPLNSTSSNRRFVPSVFLPHKEITPVYIGFNEVLQGSFLGVLQSGGRSVGINITVDRTLRITYFEASEGKWQEVKMRVKEWE